MTPATHKTHRPQLAPWAVLKLALLLSGAACAADQLALADLAALPLEKLLTLEVSSASRFEQSLGAAPATATVINAQEIRDMGYRSLADILRAMPGLAVSYDRNYSYLGVRGFARSGDYNARVLLLVDGDRFNDNIYDQASIGSDFPIDVGLIDRVEFVPGPGSSAYGSNALLGVINVITRRAADLEGAELALAQGSWNTWQGRASFGKKLAGDGELLLSASSLASRGQDLTFPELADLGVADGVVRGLDYDRNLQWFARYSQGPWSLQALHGERVKGIPTAAFATVAGMQGTETLDATTHADLRYRETLANDWQVQARAFFGDYRYRGRYLYDLPPLVLNRDEADAQWWGFEAKLIGANAGAHRWLAGLEYQRDARQQQRNFDQEPYRLNLDDSRRGNRLGIYAEDEWRVAAGSVLNAGLRFDHRQGFGDQWSPRLALVQTVGEGAHFKLIYGEAYRVPNAYELYYALAGAGGQNANPDLRPEHVRTFELALERLVGERQRWYASLFHYRLRDLIAQTSNTPDGLPVFENQAGLRATGLTLGFERAGESGDRLRASYSGQSISAENGEGPINSPRQLLKLTYAGDLPLLRLRAGLELQYVGRRRSLAGELGGYTLANAVLGFRLRPDTLLSLGLYNAFDRRYADPAGYEHVFDQIVQDGRNYRLSLEYHWR